MGDLAVSEMTTYRWSFDEDVKHYLAAGIGAIGVWRQKLADYGEARGAELIRERGLKVSSLQWAGGFTGSDGRSYHECVADGREALRTAASLKAGCLVLHSGARGSHTHSHARRLFRSAIEKLLPIAEEVGVILAIEPMGRECGAEWTFLNDWDDALTTVRAFDNDYLKLVLDTYHWGAEEQLEERLPELTPQLALVQLGDSRQPPRGEQNRCPLGEGVVPHARIIETLLGSGYRGFFEVELMGEEIESSNYHDILESSQQAFTSWTEAVSR